MRWSKPIILTLLVVIVSLIVSCSKVVISDETSSSSFYSIGSVQVIDVEDNVIRINEEINDGPVLLWFYRGYQCSICRKELLELQDNYELLLEHGVRVIVVSDDSLSGCVSVKYELQLSFSVVYDESGTVSRAFGAYDEEHNTTDPAAFVIGKRAQVYWSFIGINAGDRPRIDSVVEEALRVGKIYIKEGKR